MKTILGDLDLKKIAERLARTDEFILHVLAVRLAQGGLSDFVAINKAVAAKDGIFDKRRQGIEDERIAKMKFWAEELGLDPNYAASLMYQIISESCRRQDSVMIREFNNKQTVIGKTNQDELYAHKKENLLALTEKIAESYDEHYAERFFATKLYLSFEKHTLYKLLAILDDKSLAIDLGCATGIVSYEIASQFKKVVGYDISPDMIKVANEKKNGSKADNLKFVKTDIEERLNVKDESVSLAVMNLGTASDIKNIKGVIKSVKKALKNGGKFLFSFHNSESLLAKTGFLPWPMSLAAHMDPATCCLEVFFNDQMYFLYTRPYSIDEVRALIEDSGLSKREWNELMIAFDLKDKVI